MDPNSQPAPAAPAAPTPSEPAAPAPAPAAPVAPVVDPAAPAAPAPRTQDPVDHSVPAVDPNAPPADPAADPAADPETPDPAAAPAADPNAEPDAAALAGDVEDDELANQIKEAEARDGALPEGINPDGTINPLVYAYENMPTITVQGKEGLKGEVKEYQVKTAEDLPADFRFANQVEQAKFSSALQQNMNIAQELISEANGHNEQRVNAIARREVLVGQKNEVDALIKSGKLPAITAKPGDANFMQDPGAVRAQQVLDHMKEVNAANKAAGINQEITSVALGLQLLEAKEAIEGKQARMGTISDTRNSVNAKISGGGAAPAADGANNGQTIHKDVNSAIRAARRKHGI